MIVNFERQRGRRLAPRSQATEDALEAHALAAEAVRLLQLAISYQRNVSGYLNDNDDAA